MIDKSVLPVVTSPRLFTDKNNEKIDEEGLLSQKIFGPMRSYHCSCGCLTSKILHRNQRCAKCGVLCVSADVRYKTFAKIVLPFPIYKPTQQTLSKLQRIVGQKHKHILDPLQSDLTITTANYLKYDANKDRMSISPNYDPTDTIPLRITGSYTLYLSILAAWKCMGSLSAEEIIKNCFDYELLVTPPGTRIVLASPKDGNQQIISHSLNDFYASILRLCKFDWVNITDPLKNEEIYVKMVNNTIGSPNPIVDQEIMFYDQAICKYQYYTNLIYKEIIESLSGKEGYVRKDFLGRSVDFSSRSHIIVDPSLKPFEIKISKKAFLRLWFIEYLRFLYLNKAMRMEDFKVYIKSTENRMNVQFLEHVDEFIEYFFSDKVNYRKRLVLINRQPTLFRYGIPCVQVIGLTHDDVIAVSPFLLEPMNADFDGDTAAIYRIHDELAQKELDEKAYYLNNIKYDHNPNFLQTIRMESIYSAYVLLSSKVLPGDPIICDNLEDIQETFEDWVNFRQPVLFNGKVYSYGICIFNKWCGFNDIKIDRWINNNNVSSVIYNDIKSNIEFHDRITHLNKKLLAFVTIHPTEVLSISLQEVSNLKIDNHRDLLAKLPKNPHIGQHLYDAITTRIYDSIPDEYRLKRLTQTKLKRTQLSRLIGSIGYIADDKNVILEDPLPGSLFNGLDPVTFFKTAYGSRKGITDKSRVTPDSGYLERSLVLNLSPVEIAEDDCGTNFGFNIEIMDKQHAESLLYRYYFNDNGDQVLFTEEDVKTKIGQTLIFRSAITCQSPDFKICKKCFGEYDVKTPYVGILTGQYLSERMTQLTMRTFHTSGSCSLHTDKKLVTFMIENLINIRYWDEQTFTVEFAIDIPDTVKDIISQLPGFLKFSENSTAVWFNDIYKVENEDVTKLIKEVNNLLKTEKGRNITPINEVYQKYISSVLPVGEIYSSYIEIVLCNMYITKDNIPLRYKLKDGLNIQPYRKLSVRKLHTIVSKLLGLLFEPNTISICRFANSNGTGLSNEKGTVLERLWGGF